MDYVVNVKNREIAEMQKQVDDYAAKGYRPVSNMFEHGGILNLFMVRGKVAPKAVHTYLIGSGRRVEEITRWTNSEYENGWRVIEGFCPVEADNFMYILVKSKKQQ